ncbi:alkanesulfonate monooxygenase SsuD/methylene tetrahydromethanopterin reductase-like flavin-dependent oxidoreductase (luciferase family) [Nocardia kruczakiae]|uniref:Alkanesulfonate monooxygenase SsuD/methylene tetrahydromethanopterin reductase-like flavin-dependent oxidoreductase (Luciferase family) n=1 Tax=Nocardia kruczakiae TaxID=261477 RepID=A0ABU1X9U1_9NOCA|nr:LLM class flavin-dependent oxidoreductase [Nocardia kruczakiae]MDR7167313.1 alkanesulfonate monooxygenase SsuD/methylene tetrahydromethanopterin reductase-like flavin-dependent oxidoreductase (luciferase family) [Nocardia kruczakiae]
MHFGMLWPGAELAAEAEKSGVSAFCTGEFVDLEAYSTLADMVDRTTDALVGTSIAYAFARTPYAHAAAARSLSKKAPGRVFIGLGSGAYTINRDWFGVEADRPVARMSDMAGAIRAWLHAENGQRVVYDGEYYQVNAKVQAPVLGRLDVPVLFAGFNKVMAGAGARVGDGVIGHGLFTVKWWDEVVRPATAAGFAERVQDDDRRAPVEHGWLITAIDDADPARAIRDARRMVAFYLTVKTYDPFVEAHGWGEQVDRLRAAFAKGDMDGLAAAVTDDMLAAIAVCGTSADAREQFAVRHAEGSLARDVTYLAPPSFLVSDRRRAVYARNSLVLIDQTSTGERRG